MQEAQIRAGKFHLWWAVVGIGGVELAAIRSDKTVACPRGSRPNTARHRGKYDFYTVELFRATSRSSGTDHQP